MYPVFSLLRRMAAVHIYATPEMLEVSEGAFHIRVNKATDYADLARAKWIGPGELVPFGRAEVVADSSVAAAIALATKENKLAESLRTNDLLYTMVVGPEGEVELDGGKVRRHCTYALVRGVFRASAGKLVHEPAKASQKANFRRRPKGTVRL